MCNLFLFVNYIFNAEYIGQNMLIALTHYYSTVVCLHLIR